MGWLTIVRARLPLRRFLLVIVLAISCAGQALAHERSLQPVVQGDLAPGVPQTFTVRAGAGDLIFGAFEPRAVRTAATFGEALYTVALYDESGSKVKEEPYWGSYSGPLPFGFVTPTSGIYRIRVAARSPGSGSYTLRTEHQTPAEQVAGVVVWPTVRDESARVTQLVRDMRRGQAGALERFWSEAKARGGPLVETIDGSDHEVLVTFLWKEIYQTHNVLLVWGGDIWQGEVPQPQDYMSRVPRTNVWYKTLRVIRGSRFSYQIAPNDGRAYPHYTAQTDPLNPRLLPEGDRSNAGGSLFELPGAPDESWYRRTPSIRGTIAPHTLDSLLLKGRRDVSVYTPPGYAPANGPYPLLILFDGPLYTADRRASNTLDNLIANRRIRPTVVCFVGNTPDGMRSADLPNPIFAAAMATELVPLLRSAYAVSTDPKDVVIGGWSAGGGAAGYLALNYPSLFGNVLLQSGGGRLIPLIVDGPKVPVRFYLDVGLYEGGILVNRRLRDALQARGYDVTYRETGGAHEGIHYWATLAEGLTGLFGQPAK